LKQEQIVVSVNGSGHFITYIMNSIQTFTDR